jgi:hypothetical protein
MDKMYELKFGESFKDEKSKYIITRVPGGWLFYKDIERHHHSSKTSVFVPFSTEFQNKN